MRPRIEQELALLRRHFLDVQHAETAGDDWFRLPCYPLCPGWRIAETPVTHTEVAFHAAAGHPGTAPYGFLTPVGLNFNGAAPGNTGGPPKAPPFPGSWLHFSWSVDDWAATADVTKGSNLLSWARGIAHRFREGA